MVKLPNKTGFYCKKSGFPMKNSSFLTYRPPAFQTPGSLSVMVLKKTAVDGSVSVHRTCLTEVL